MGEQNSAELLKTKLQNIYSLMLSNARNRRPVHPLVYAKYIQDIIDLFNGLTEFNIVINHLRLIIKRIRSHIEYNAHNMESMYCQEISQVINMVDQISKISNQDKNK